MAKLSTSQFLDYLTQSGLVAENDLNRSLDNLREKFGGELPADAESAADWFICGGLITRWHADKLFDRKFKGFQLGKYKLLSLLGYGEMSSVYLAEHVLMKWPRAIKILPKSKSFRNSKQVVLFHLEAQVACLLQHPNIVPTYGVDNDGEQYFMVMEYVDGKTLQRLVEETGPLPLPLACEYIAQAAEGLDYAHRNSVIHCDVKPANIMVDKNGLVRVLDLGLALHGNAWWDSLSAIHRDELLSTATYLSPEQVVDSLKVDLRTDIYNLGCTLYFLLTAHPPFPAGSYVQRIALHMKAMPVSVTQDRPDCPEDLAAICLKMLQKNPDLRYQSMQEVIHALDRWLMIHGFGRHSPGR